MDIVAHTSLHIHAVGPRLPPLALFPPWHLAFLGFEEHGFVFHERLSSLSTRLNRSLTRSFILLRKNYTAPKKWQAGGTPAPGTSARL